MQAMMPPVQGIGTIDQMINLLREDEHSLQRIKCWLQRYGGQPNGRSDWR